MQPIIVPRYTKIVCLYLIFSAVSIYAATIGFKIFIYFHHCFNTYLLAIYVFKGENLHILIFSFEISYVKLLYSLTVNLLIKLCLYIKK